jgi:hypothetical protein
VFWEPFDPDERHLFWVDTVYGFFDYGIRDQIRVRSDDRLEFVVVDGLKLGSAAVTVYEKVMLGVGMGEAC